MRKGWWCWGWHFRGDFFLENVLSVIYCLSLITFNLYMKSVRTSLYGADWRNQIFNVGDSMIKHVGRNNRALCITLCLLVEHALRFVVLTHVRPFKCWSINTQLTYVMSFPLSADFIERKNHNILNKSVASLPSSRQIRIQNSDWNYFIIVYIFCYTDFSYKN